jgi:DNA-binding SARP family transcriptional activator
MTNVQGTASAAPPVDRLIESLLARLESSGSMAPATDLLDRVLAILDPVGEPAMAALLVATHQIAARWRCEAQQVEIYRRAQSNAVDCEAETRHSLIAAVHAVAEMITESMDRPGVSPPYGTGDGRQPRPGRTDGSAGEQLTAYLLGFCEIRSRGHTIEGWRGAKAGRIVRYLAFRCGQPAHRDVLIETFWPESDTETGRRNLHQTMYLIRRALRDHSGMNYIAYENEAYAVDRGAGFWCDVEEFELRVAAGRRADGKGLTDEADAEFDRALVLYTGDLLEDLPHEGWVLTERDRLRLAYLDCANRLAELRLARGAVDAALEISQQVLRRDPCDEAAHRRAMSCYSLTGRRPLVVQQYRTCSAALADTLELAPSRETTELYCSLVDR